VVPELPERGGTTERGDRADDGDQEQLERANDPAVHASVITAVRSLGVSRD
jgi:hypothetical protein